MVDGFVSVFPTTATSVGNAVQISEYRILLSFLLKHAYSSQELILGDVPVSTSGRSPAAEEEFV